MLRRYRRHDLKLIFITGDIVADSEKLFYVKATMSPALKKYFMLKRRCRLNLYFILTSGDVVAKM